MDVTCDRCKTEYEFDDALATERGTTVKCTQCGFTFKVYRPGAAKAEQAEPWHLRRRSGASEVIGSLRDLQQRIALGELTADDLLARPGEPWKRLGDIIELETMFSAARAREATAASYVASSAPPTGTARRARVATLQHGVSSAPPPAYPGNAPARVDDASPGGSGAPRRDPKRTALGLGPGTLAGAPPEGSSGAQAASHAFGEDAPTRVATMTAAELMAAAEQAAASESRTPSWATENGNIGPRVPSRRSTFPGPVAAHAAHGGAPPTGGHPVSASTRTATPRHGVPAASGWTHGDPNAHLAHTSDAHSASTWVDGAETPAHPDPGVYAASAAHATGSGAHTPLRRDDAFAATAFDAPAIQEASVSHGGRSVASPDGGRGVPPGGMTRSGPTSAWHEGADEALGYSDTVRPVVSAASGAARSETVPSGSGLGPRSQPPAHEGPARTSSRPLYVDEDDDSPERAPGRRSRLGVLSLVIVLAGVGTAAYLAWPDLRARIESASGGGKLDEFLREGDRAFALDHRDGYQAAIGHYTRAAGAAEGRERDQARAAERLSRAYAALALLGELEADDVAARGGEASVLRATSRQHAGQALTEARAAVAADREGGLAALALADALRLANDLDGAEREARRARGAEHDRPPEGHVLVLEGLLAVAGRTETNAQPNADPGEAPDAASRTEPAGSGASAPAAVPSAVPASGLAAGLPAFRRAVAADPSFLRARWLVARAELAANEVSAARSTLEALLAASPEHPIATQLLEAIARHEPPAPTEIAVPDDAAPSGASAPPVEPANPTAAERASSEREAGASSDEAGETAPRGRDYDWYIGRAASALQRGRTREAEQLYRAALGVRSGPEAHSGLGYVAMDRGDYEVALRSFHAAGNFGDAYIGLGQAYRATGRYEAALRAYELYLERVDGAQRGLAMRHRDELRRLLGGGVSAPEVPARVAPDGDDPSRAPSGALPSLDSPGTGDTTTAPTAPSDPGASAAPSAPGAPSDPEPPPSAAPGTTPSGGTSSALDRRPAGEVPEGAPLE